MRKFSEEEQLIIKKIVTGESHTLQYVLLNVYYDIFYNNKIYYDTQNPEKLTFYRNIKEVDINEILYVQKQIIILSRLIKYLEENRFVYLIEIKSENEITNTEKLFAEKDDLIPVTNSIDKITAEILKDSFKYYVIVTEDLKKLVENNFVSDEDIRHQEQLQKSEEAYKVAKDSYKVAKDSYEVAKDSYEVTKDSCEVAKDSYKVAKDSYEVAKGSYEVTKDSCEVAKDSYEYAQKSYDVAKNSHIVAKNSHKVACLALLLSMASIIISLITPVKLNKSQYNEIISSISTSKATTQCDSIKISNDSSKSIEFVNSIKVSNDSIKSIEFIDSIKISNDSI